MVALTPNGLSPHGDFPSECYEAVHARVAGRWSALAAYHQFSGAWNALAYRFHGSVDAGAKFQKSLKDYGSHPAPYQRYQQEEALFNFFSNGFATFEALFYGLFAIGSFINPTAFPLVTPKDQQRVSPSYTDDAFKRAFPGDPLLDAFAAVLGDADYQRWRDMRNVLTHRAAPGRRIFVGIGHGDAPPVEWRLNDTPLDFSLIPKQQRELTQLISGVLSAADRFLVKLA